MAGAENLPPDMWKRVNSLHAQALAAVRDIEPPERDIELGSDAPSGDRFGLGSECCGWGHDRYDKIDLCALAREHVMLDRRTFAMLRHPFLPVLLVVLLTLVTSCSISSESETFETSLTASTADFNPAATAADLAERSQVAVEVTLVDVEDGRYFGDQQGEPEGVHLNLVFESGQGDTYYVQIPRSIDSDVDTLRELFPLGSRNVIFLIPNDDPIDGIWFNVREDGNEWFFTTPQGWILEDPGRGIIWPLRGLTDEPPFPEDPAPRDLEDWLG